MPNLKERAKKILREPLFYIIPLFALFATLALYLTTTSESPKISDITITRNNKTESIQLPYSIYTETGEVFLISFNLFVKNNEPLKLHITPDDCVQGILVNETEFALKGIKELCNYRDGEIFDFSPYVKEGLNNFKIRVINSGGGPGGVKIEPYYGFGNFSLIHYILILLFLLIIVFILRKLNPQIETFRQSLLKLLLLSIAAIILTFVAVASGAGIIPDRSIIFLISIFFGTAFIFLINRQINYTTFIFILTALAMLILIRGGLLYFKSSDYNNFLAPWIGQMRGLSIKEALTTKIGDYNMPYLYALMFISRVQISGLYLIKLISISFDIVLAYYVMKIISLKFNNINIQIAAFIATLSIPTVILNGAFWGQCDVIYAALSLAFIYYGITGKSIKALAFLGLAFSAKLQTIFIAPMLIVFLFTKKIHIKYIWALFAAFFLTLVPALIAGRSFIETISIYSEQTNAYPQMVLGIINIYVLLGNVAFANFNYIAILIAGIAVTSLLHFLYINRKKITSHADYISIAFAFVLIIPMLLPRMHERYFFLADVLSVVLVFFNKKRWYFAPIIIMGSYMTYTRFLMGKEHLVLAEHASIVMIFVTLLAVKDLVKERM